MCCCVVVAGVFAVCILDVFVGIVVGVVAVVGVAVVAVVVIVVVIVVVAFVFVRCFQIILCCCCFRGCYLLLLLLLALVFAWLLFLAAVLVSRLYDVGQALTAGVDGMMDND